MYKRKKYHKKYKPYSAYNILSRGGGHPYSSRAINKSR